MSAGFSLNFNKHKVPTAVFAFQHSHWKQQDKYPICKAGIEAKWYSLADIRTVSIPSSQITLGFTGKQCTITTFPKASVLQCPFKVHSFLGDLPQYSDIPGHVYTTVGLREILDLKKNILPIHKIKSWFWKCSPWEILYILPTFNAIDYRIFLDSWIGWEFKEPFYTKGTDLFLENYPGFMDSTWLASGDCSLGKLCLPLAAVPIVALFWRYWQ